MSAAAFQDLESALDHERSEVHPSEAHGCLSGALCASGVYTLHEWLEELLPGTVTRDPSDPALGGFATVYDGTHAVLQAGEMNFEPLLPDDDTPLGRRVEALGLWCQGFLYGFGTAGLARNEALPPDVAEILADFGQLARAGEDEEADPEEQERAYTELVEFVRASTQLVFDELEPRRQQHAEGSGRSH